MQASELSVSAIRELLVRGLWSLASSNTEHGESHISMWPASGTAPGESIPEVCGMGEVWRSHQVPGVEQIRGGFLNMQGSPDLRFAVAKLLTCGSLENAL